MLKQVTSLAFIFLMALTGLCIYYVFMRAPLNNKVPKQSIVSKKVNSDLTKQIRRHVQKDLWISSDDSRLHHQMISPYSTLVASPKGNHVELIEVMQGMKCYLQEKIETEKDPVQHIRLIESDLGTYRYADHHFDAPQVFLALFRLPGNHLNTHLDLDTAFLKGVAEDVSLSFTQNSPDFQAKKFKANVQTKKPTYDPKST